MPRARDVRARRRRGSDVEPQSNVVPASPGSEGLSHMSDTLSDVLVAGYRDIDTATADFDTLIAAGQGEGGPHRGGHPRHPRHRRQRRRARRPATTSAARARAGVASVGFLVGLAAPPLLAATVVGAAAGGIAGKFAKHRVETGIHDKIGEALPPGTRRDHRHLRRATSASPWSRLLAGRTRASPSSRRTSPARRRSRTRSRRRWASSPRTGRCCRSRTATFGGIDRARTMDESVGGLVDDPGPKAPEGAPNVLVVLIDDAGFGGPRHVRRSSCARRPDARPADGPHLQPLPRDGRLLADPRGAAHRAQPPPRGHGSGSRSSRARSRATRRTGRGAAPACRGSSRTTATSRAASASGT